MTQRCTEALFRGYKSAGYMLQVAGYQGANA
jgi:hypothetical protein